MKNTYKDLMFQEFLTVVGEVTQKDTSDVTLETSLEELGMTSSYDAIHLLVEIEVKWRIQFPDYMVKPEMFKTVGSVFLSLMKVVGIK